MESPVRQPYLGHLLIVVLLLASLGVVRAVYVTPRDREARALRAERARLEADLADLRRGLTELGAWERAHPGEDASRFSARRARPARAMVAEFLRRSAPIADRWGVRTERIQSAGMPVDVTTAGASGEAEAYRRVELRFRIDAPYRPLGEYLREVEAMDQLVVVRSVSIRNASKAPELSADVTVWLFGIP